MEAKSEGSKVDTNGGRQWYATAKKAVQSVKETASEAIHSAQQAAHRAITRAEAAAITMRRRRQEPTNGAVERK